VHRGAVKQQLSKQPRRKRGGQAHA
jgi:hypothetical protein